MSRNLIKANQFVIKEREPVVLDSNDLFAKKIEIYKKSETSEGFQTGIFAPHIDQVELEDQIVGGGVGVQEEASAFIPQQPVYEGPTPEEMIQAAKDEIEQLHAEADKAISFLKKRAMEEGHQEGYQEGQIIALREIDVEKKKLKEKEAELEREFQKRVDALEVKFVETLTGIYEEIFKVELSSYKPLLLNAIANTIRSVEGAKDFIVHVSKEDYREVIEAKEDMIAGMISKNVSVEVVEDITMKQNDCMIETSAGIYDCGIGTQLSELKRRLRLLSYEN